MKSLISKPYQRKRGPMGNAFVLTALRFFGIIEDQINSLSLRDIKTLAKKEYAKCLYKIHPDRGGKGHLWRYQQDPRYKPGEGDRVYIAQLKRMFERIKRLKYKYFRAGHRFAI